MKAGMVSWPSIGCDRACGFEPSGVGMRCSAGDACGRYLHPGDPHHAEVAEYYACIVREQEAEDAYAAHVAAERERLLREHGGKQLVVWRRRDEPWSVLFSLGFELCLSDLAELCEYSVFGLPPDDGLWLWSGAYECRQTGYEEVEFDDVAFGEWRRLTPAELEQVAVGVEPWARGGAS